MTEEELKSLKEKMHDHEKRIVELENILKGRKDIPVTHTITEIQKLSTKLGIQEDKLNEIFDKEESVLTVIKCIGADDREKTQNIALLTLFGYKIFFGKEEVLSQEIRRNVAENKISRNNFSAYINGLMPQFLRRKGELRSPKTTYRLNIEGEVRAKDLIKSILLSKG